MLSKFFESKDDYKLIKIILIVLFFFFMLYVIFVGKPASSKKVSYDVSKNKIIELFNLIEDNYTLTIERNIDGNSEIIVYYNDSKNQMFEVNNNIYLKHNNKLYLVKQIDSNNYKITKSNEKLSIINDSFADIDLIKKIVNYCEFEYINPVKVTCKINYTDYLKEFNIKNNSEYSINYDNKMSFDIVYYDDEIGKLIIDYTKISEIIYGTNQNIIYGIKINNINSNNFDLLIEKYKKELKK